MSEGGAIKVTKYSLVLLKAKLEGGLYVVVESTIVDSINTPTV